MTPSAAQLARTQDLQPLLDQVVAAGAPGIVARVQTSTDTVQLVSGVANRDTGAPMTPEEVATGYAGRLVVTAPEGRAPGCRCVDRSGIQGADLVKRARRSQGSPKLLLVGLFIDVTREQG